MILDWLILALWCAMIGLGVVFTLTAFACMLENWHDVWDGK